MEILVILAAFILFDIVVWIWGYDSRVGVDEGRQVNPPSRRWI